MHVHVYTFVHLQGSDFVFECVHNHSTNNVGGDVMVQQSLNLATDNKNVRMSRVSCYFIIICGMAKRCGHKNDGLLWCYQKT